jgi:hypothetical protein
MTSYKLSKFCNAAQKIVDGRETGEWANIDSNQEYLKWLEEGNQPLPADEPNQE